ncbi:hypothetical protein C8R45DRAFT_393687 [Mycena sanguinolenta]|nr:hypothetical protein C8R45DRAFT_393687 [Mycena sanguinolenta]
MLQSTRAADCDFKMRYLALLAAVQASCAALTPVVETTSGLLNGTETNGLSIFKGVVRIMRFVFTQVSMVVAIRTSSNWTKALGTTCSIHLDLMKRYSTPRRLPRMRTLQVNFKFELQLPPRLNLSCAVFNCFENHRDLVQCGIPGVVSLAFKLETPALVYSSLWDASPLLAQPWISASSSRMGRTSALIQDKRPRIPASVSLRCSCISVSGQEWETLPLLGQEWNSCLK